MLLNKMLFLTLSTAHHFFCPEEIISAISCQEEFYPLRSLDLDRTADS